MFDIKRFTNERIAVHCRTNRSAENFLSMLEAKEIISSEDKTIFLGYYDSYKDETCFSFGGKLVYSPLYNYINHGYLIYEWQEDEFISTEPINEKTETPTELFARVIEHYGKDLQTIIAIEEMTELTKILTKQLRGSGNREHIAEEMADIYICLQQLKIMYDISDEVVEKWIKWKTERIEMRLKEAGKNGA